MDKSEDLEKRAMGLALQVVTIAQTLNHELHLEIQKKSNIPQDQYAVHTTFLDIVYYGLYLFWRRNPYLLQPEIKDKFNVLLREQFVFAVMLLAYSSVTDAAVIKELKEQLPADYDIKMALYFDYRGEVSLILRDRLAFAFLKSSKVKFFEDSFFTRVEEIHAKNAKRKWPFAKVPEDKMQLALSNALRKQGAEYALPETFLKLAAQAITETFEETEIVKPE
jgi:hypothetical protein